MCLAKNKCESASMRFLQEMVIAGNFTEYFVVSMSKCERSRSYRGATQRSVPPGDEAAPQTHQPGSGLHTADLPRRGCRGREKFHVQKCTQVFFCEKNTSVFWRDERSTGDICKEKCQTQVRKCKYRNYFCKENIQGKYYQGQ